MSGDLSIRDVTVEYTSGSDVVRPVDGFSCEIHDGALALLLGPSGCGKTTLLSCLAGILRPMTGTIPHGDRELTALTGHALTDYRRNGVGIVFQAFNLVPSLTALDNVMLPMRSAGVSRADARRRAEGLLEEMDLTPRSEHLPARLSGGQQQRVAIARALSMEPPLLLADEPTAHLDYVQVEATLRILRRLAQPGRVVVVVTHDDRLLPLADQVIELIPHVAPVTDQLVTRTLEPGEVLFNQGEPSDVVYTVDAGQIEIVRRVSGGGEESLAVMSPGDHFGEMGPLFGLPRSATARAVGPVRLTGRSIQAFRELVGTDHLAGLWSQSPGSGS